MTEKKEWIRSVFDRAAPAYGGARSAFFGTFGKRLVELAHLAPGDHILDIACGKGAVLIPAAQAVGPEGSAQGIDLSSEMVALTSKALSDEGLTWATAQQMDAEHLTFADATFDVVFCAFALFFFPHLEQTLTEFHRVLKPGGRLIVSTWSQKPPLSAWINQEAQQLGAEEGLAVTLLDTEASLRSALSSAPFQSIELLAESIPFWHASPEAWWESLWEHGTRARLERLPIPILKQLKAKALERAASIQDDRGVSEELRVLYGLCVKK